MINTTKSAEIVRVFTMDANKHIAQGSLLPKTTAEKFVDSIRRDRIQQLEKTKQPRVVINYWAERVKHVLLPPDATVEDAKKAFDAMA